MRQELVIHLSVFIGAPSVAQLFLWNEANFSSPALTGGAEMRGSAAEDDAFEGRIASVARLASAGVDAMEGLESPAFAVGVDVVAERAAAVADRALERQLDRLVQSGDLVGFQPVGAPERVD